MFRRSSPLSLCLISLILNEVSATAEVIRPNVRFIAVDDPNHWGGRFQAIARGKTPHIDRLSKQSIC